MNTTSTNTNMMMKDSSSIERQMEVVTYLINARAEGKATNAEVELAVDRLLELQQPEQQQQQQQQQQSNSTISPALDDTIHQELQKQAPQVTSNRIIQQDDDDDDDDDEIIQDTENYDDDDDDDDNNNTTEKSIIEVSNDNTKNDDKVIDQASTSTPPVLVKRKRGRPFSSSSSVSKIMKSIDYSVYDDIPLGRQGAKMMTTFGDGRYPIHTAVAATLLGTRRLLQVTIQDARYIRRKQKQLYTAAKHYVRHKKVVSVSLSDTSTNATSNTTLQSEFSSELLFRASEKYDRLSWDPKCGFDIEELRLLYQEEMNAFNRWMELHEDAQDDVVDDGKKYKKNKNKNNKNTKLQVDNNNDDEEYGGGHLRSRASQFDIRTDQMKQDWYMRFSELRKGSFLPRGGGGGSMSSTNTTNTTTANDDITTTDETIIIPISHDTKRTRGGSSSSSKHHQGTWKNLSISSIRFLHWIGFDPNSPLPPPDDLTTQALAFLGYDFVGRIVEKAISLRIERQQQQQQQHDGQNKSKLSNMKYNNNILELDDGEQLELYDIQLALQDADFNQQPLCSSIPRRRQQQQRSSSSSSSTDHGSIVSCGQLYFGPGFEERLELEMEELVRSIDQNDIEQTLTDDEYKIRQEEDELFLHLASVEPTTVSLQQQVSTLSTTTSLPPQLQTPSTPNSSPIATNRNNNNNNDHDPSIDC